MKGSHVYATLSLLSFALSCVACLAQHGEHRTEDPAVVRPSVEVSRAKANAVTAVTQRGCPPCARLEPIFKRLRAEGYQATKVDVSQTPVEVTPTLIFYRDGREVERHKGFMNYEQIVQRLEKPLLGERRILERIRSWLSRQR